MTDLTWARLLDEYETAIRRHEALSRALTEALVSRSDGAELQRLEAEAKRTAQLVRTRLIDFMLGDDDVR